LSSNSNPACAPQVETCAFLAEAGGCVVEFVPLVPPQPTSERRTINPQRGKTLATQAA
jgi:hypothetical protein